jgi:hypothetical protein
MMHAKQIIHDLKAENEALRCLAKTLIGTLEGIADGDDDIINDLLERAKIKLANKDPRP